MNETRELTIADREITHTQPIGLQYFHAVDAMVEGETPDDGKYFNILVYGPQQDQPAVIILRTESHYTAANIGKQDEISLETRKDRLTFNAETKPDGVYIKYPNEISTAGMDYLQETIDTFSTLANQDGSLIRINNTDKMVAQQGKWVTIRPEARRSPRLNTPQKQLPN